MLYRMHTPAPDAEPGPHDPSRVVPLAPVPPEMEPLVPEPSPEKPLHPSRDVPGEPPSPRRLAQNQQQRLHATKVLDRVDDDRSADGNQQNVCCDAHETVSWRRAPEPDDQFRRNLVEDDVPRQRPPEMPLFRLTRRHAAVAFLG